MSGGMRLTVVGCSGSFPGPESAASSYLVEAGDGDRTWRILVDIGSGAVGPLQRYVDPVKLDAVLLSHLHPDHFFDLSGLYVIWKYHPDGPAGRIPVWGPAGVAKQAARAYGLSPHPGMTREFDFHEYGANGARGDRPIRVGPFTVHHVRVAHPVPAYALRIEANGRTLTYSGDTGPCPQLPEIAKGADLLLAEAAFQDGPENPPDLHLTGSQAAHAAVAADVGRLVLTHGPPWHDPQVALTEAGGVYGGPIDLAAPGVTYDV
jgi:ribonuclease BN (tRNA processing enzyme)